MTPPSDSLKYLIYFVVFITAIDLDGLSMLCFFTQFLIGLK